MPGFSDRLAAMKAKQAEGEQKRSAEQASAEAAAKRSALAESLEARSAELRAAEQEAHGAEQAIAEADAFAQEQGEDLDPGAKAEIDAIKEEAGQVQAKLQELASEVARIQEELAELEGNEAERVVTETPPAFVDETATVAEEGVEPPSPVEVGAEATSAAPEAIEESNEAPAEAGSLEALQDRYQAFTEKSLEALGDANDAQLKELQEHFTEKNLEVIPELIKTLEAKRDELYAFTEDAMAQIQNKDPKIQEKVKRAVQASERKLTALINNVRENARLITIHQKPFELPVNLKEHVQKIGESGLVGESELQKMLHFEESTSENEEHALVRFVRRFERPYGGGLDLGDKVTESGISFLEEKKSALEKYPALAAEFEKTLNLAKGSQERRDNTMRSSPKGTWA